MRGLIGAALCLLAAAPARAGVVVRTGVPFTAAQLEAAIAARGGDGGGAGLDVEVSRPSPEQLELVTPAGRWQIEIGAASGEAAARVVALHVVGLAVAPPAAAASAATEAPGISAAAEVRAALASPRPPARYRLAVLGVGARGVRADDFASVGGAIEVTRAGRWIAGGGIAYQRGLTIDRPPAMPIGADLIRVRAVAGAQLGPIELVGGGFAGRVIVDGGTGAISAWTTGLHAEARVVAPISGAWSVVIAASAEVFRERIEVRLDGARLGSTPRGAIGGGLGLAWTGGRPR